MREQKKRYEVRGETRRERERKGCKDSIHPSVASSKLQACSRLCWSSKGSCYLLLQGSMAIAKPCIREGPLAVAGSLLHLYCAAAAAAAAPIASLSTFPFQAGCVCYFTFFFSLLVFCYLLQGAAWGGVVCCTNTTKLPVVFYCLQQLTDEMT